MIHNVAHSALVITVVAIVVYLLTANRHPNGNTNSLCQSAVHILGLSQCHSFVGQYITRYIRALCALIATEPVPGTHQAECSKQTQCQSGLMVHSRKHLPKHVPFHPLRPAVQVLHVHSFETVLRRLLCATIWQRV